jgi:hypothetical protein
MKYPKNPVRRGLVTLIALAAVTVAGQLAYAGSLKFEAEVPKAPAGLPVLKLAAQPAPVDLVNRLLAAANAGTKLTPLSEAPYLRKNQIKVPDEMVGVVEGEHVKAWANLRTGDAAIYPTLAALKPISPGVTSDLAARTGKLFQTPGLISRDDTRFVVDKPNILNGATLARDPNGNTRPEKPAAPYLVYVSARRIVADLPVDGPGSRVLLAVGANGSVEGLTRVWKSAKNADTVRPLLTGSQVRDEIAKQLEPAVKSSDVVVDHIGLAYYDGNQDFLQPVYRYTARIRHVDTNTKPATDDDFIIGYIPFGKAFEPLPSINQMEGPSPSDAAPTPTMPAGEAAPVSPADPIVGRYVVRNDDPGWVNDANAFWGSLSSTWTGFLYTNSQYYWAEPRLFTTQKDFFINAMNLAVIEVHGDWWLYSTLKNCCDLVNINGDIPSPGYGPSANGRLADWVIHSCEVVPAPPDTAQWPAPWWKIFGGVRNVVGYRTIMYISDGAGGPYGTSLGNLAPVVSSWLSDVISLNAYAGHPTAAAHNGIVRPMGRPSTISMCGHDGDSALSTSSLGRANCLTVWWFPD